MEATMKWLGKSWIVGAIVLVVACLAVSSAWAAYDKYGVGMDVQTGSVANGVLHVQNYDLWSNTWGGSQAESVYSQAFTGLTCDSYVKAWLVTEVYGGAITNTAKITATINGHKIADSLAVGGASSGDTGSNVYGSSVGIWVLSLPIDPSYLNTNGTANQVSVVVGDKTKGAGATSYFDGRSSYQTLVTISQNGNLGTSLDYALAVGGGDIGTSSGYVTSRTLNLGSFSIDTFVQADLYGTYIYGSNGQMDKLLLNGNSLLGDDVAKGIGVTDYPSDFVYASVPEADLLATGNTLKYTVDAADFPAGSTRESSVRPEFAILGVTHSVPEPGTISLLGMGAALFYFCIRRRGR
jgi:hypothetical protein